MPAITLPDGSVRQFDQSVSIMDLAADIGPGLAKATLAGKVDGELVDASYLLEQDTSVEIVTNKSDEAADIIRHSTAHLLAHSRRKI